MTESLMTDSAANTTESTATSTADVNTQSTDSVNTSEQQQATSGQDQNSSKESAEAGKTDGEQGKSDAKADGAPEKYEFAAPEGQAFDAQVIAKFSETAKELNLTQEAAQKMLDSMGSVVRDRQMEQVEAIRNEWTESSKSDKEFGGEKLNENLAVAKKALDSFGTPELRTLLNESGLGNNPEVIRFMFRAGKAISEDKYVGGSAGAKQSGPKGFNDMASSLYSNQ